MKPFLTMLSWVVVNIPIDSARETILDVLEVYPATSLVDLLQLDERSGVDVEWPMTELGCRICCDLDVRQRPGQGLVVLPHAVKVEPVQLHPQFGRKRLQEVRLLLHEYRELYAAPSG
jgi:hypothetical protein